uniref:Uncharacterized protein LOC102807207 n=1 Tax=Saccoglossus kowalevskii TaxID=10224 RepID=A0ABM0LYQ2_SACKO|nr:PREDICTED: uncharacterized protein LOC102807207 [Saccoglossus kowalevskii]
MTLIFNTLRIPLANHKTLGPVQELEYLGIMLNSKELMAFLPTDKRIGISKKLSEVLAKKSVTKQVLLSLLGHLSFAGRVVLPGRSFVSHLLQLASIVPKLHYHVAINSDCRMELAMWDSFLQSWNGVHLFLNSEVTSAADLQIYTDASSTVGFGGYFRGEWFNDCRPAELNMNNRSDLSMALLELYPIVVAAMLWGGKWSQKRIRFNCDNEATVHIINKEVQAVGSSRTAAQNAVSTILRSDPDLAEEVETMPIVSAAGNAGGIAIVMISSDLRTISLAVDCKQIEIIVNECFLTDQK